MPLLYHVTLVVHLIAMAVWFALPLSHPRRLRTALATDDAASKHAVATISREVPIVIASAFLTLLSGLGLAAQIGFPNLQTRFWIGLGITVAMQVGGGAVFGPTHGKIAALVAEGKRAETAPLMRRLAMATGMVQLLWTINVVLMTAR